MKKLLKNNKIKALLLMFVFTLTVFLAPMTKAYAATPFAFKVTSAGEAINASSSSSYQDWSVSNLKSNTYHPMINLNTKDVAVRFEWTGSFGTTFASVDGLDWGRTDTVGANDRIYLQEYRESGNKTIVTVVFKDLPVGNHKIAIKAVSFDNVIKTDYVDVNVTY